MKSWAGLPDRGRTQPGCISATGSAQGGWPAHAAYAAHLLAQLAQRQGRKVYAFTRPGDLAAQAFARQLGVAWAGGADQPPPVALDAALIFAPAGALVPRALAAVRKGGAVICGGIHMSDIPSFPYALLWGERSVRSVANLTRADGHAFLALAARYPLRVEVQTYPLGPANAALADLRAGRVHGAAVLLPSAVDYADRLDAPDRGASSIASNCAMGSGREKR